MISTASPFATDEDVALRASADFALICPADQVIASGGDGTFDASDRWTLRAATLGAEAGGLAPGHVVQLLAPSSAFGPPGEALVVVGVASGTVALRRKGQPAGFGRPPGPAAGLAGVEYLAVTLGPQIALAGEDLGRRLGIDERVPGRRAGDLYDPAALREAVVLTVLYRRYLDLGRGPGGPDDVLASKARAVKAELDEVLDRLVLRWGAAGDDAATGPTTRFSTRLAR